MTRRSLLAVTYGTDEAKRMLDAMVEEGRILSWEPQVSDWLCDWGTDGPRPFGSLLACDLSPSETEGMRARAFWDGAVEQDGSMSDAMLSLMRMDDRRREEYRKRYVSADRYVEEQACLHADAFLGPDGEWVDSSALRGRNQLHDWVVGFADRHVIPLMDMDDAADLTISMYTYLDMP